MQATPPRLAHYLDLLSGAGMLTGLQKYSGSTVRRRASSPKLQVLNTALMTALSERTLTEAREDLALWGRLVESAVGAHLANAAMAGEIALYYWRERNREVDFVVCTGRNLIAIEVKSGPSQQKQRLPGLTAFDHAFGPVPQTAGGRGRHSRRNVSVHAGEGMGRGVTPQAIERAIRLPALRGTPA